MKHIWTAFKLFLFLTFITGFVYPILITILGNVIFHRSASGQLIKRNGAVIGARSIAQKFVSEKYFWERPSSVDYNPLPSGGSNWGPTSAALKKAVLDRARVIRKVEALSQTDPIPQELLFASASGLDPDISPEAAEFQAARVAQSRGVSVEKIKDLIRSHVISPDLGFLGDPRVNVLDLNLALDEGAYAQP